MQQYAYNFFYEALTFKIETSSFHLLAIISVFFGIFCYRVLFPEAATRGVLRKKVFLEISEN